MNEEMNKHPLQIIADINQRSYVTAMDAKWGKFLKPWSLVWTTLAYTKVLSCRVNVSQWNPVARVHAVVRIVYIKREHTRNDRVRIS